MNKFAAFPDLSQVQGQPTRDIGRSAPRCPVDIDIKPASDPNSINCHIDSEVITDAIRTTDDFNALTVDQTTAIFEGASETHGNSKSVEPRRHEEDLDGDGDIDLVFQFRSSDTTLYCDFKERTLVRENCDGQADQRQLEIPFFQTRERPSRDGHRSTSEEVDEAEKDGEDIGNGGIGSRDGREDSPQVGGTRKARPAALSCHVYTRPNPLALLGSSSAEGSALLPRCLIGCLPSGPGCLPLG